MSSSVAKNKLGSRNIFELFNRNLKHLIKNGEVGGVDTGQQQVRAHHLLFLKNKNLLAKSREVLRIKNKISFEKEIRGDLGSGVCRFSLFDA